MFTRKVRNVFVVLVLVLSIGFVPAVGAEILIEPNGVREILIEPNGIWEILIEPNGVWEILIEPNGVAPRSI